MFVFSTIWRFDENSKTEYFIPFWNENIFNFEVIENQNIPQSILNNPLKVSDVCMKQDSKLASLSAESKQEQLEALKQVTLVAEKAMQWHAPFLILRPGVVFPTTLEEPSNEDKQTRQSHLNEALERYCRNIFTLAKKFPELTFCILPAHSWQEFPYASELDYIFSDLSHLKLAYWHNTASAHLLEKLGINEQEQWLEEYGHKMVGIHWEDAVGKDNLYPIGIGEINIEKIRSHLPKNIIEVLRINSRFDELAVQFAKKYLENEI